MQKSRKAFTLIEFMIVVVVLGVIASFGIPNYNKSRARLNEKNAIYSLRIIASAMEMYRVRNNGNYPLGADLDNVGEINTTLDLGTIELSMVYSCTGNGIIFTCNANPDDYTWNLQVSNTSNENPRCSAGPACPTCLVGGCPIEVN